MGFYVLDLLMLIVRDWNSMDIFATVKRVRRIATDFIFPRICVVCGHRMWETGDCNNVCDDCISRIPWIEPTYSSNIVNIHKAELRRRGFKKQLFGAGRVCFKYSGVGRRLILNLKYGNYESISRDIAFLVQKNRSDIVQYIAHSILVPVPLSYRRHLWRDYNQSALIARELAKFSDDVCVRNLLRAKHHRSQTALSPDERLRNAKDSFFARNLGKIYNKRVIVVDDVLTTGATLAACCSALFDRGFVDVDVLTLSCN